MAQAAKVEAADVERHTRAESGLPGRSIEICSPAADACDLRSEARGDRVFLRFIHLVEDVFLLRRSLLILDCHVHRGEDAQVVQAALRLDHLGLRQRVSWIEQNVSVDDPVLRDGQPTGQHLTNEAALPFDDDVFELDPVRLRGRARAPFERRARETLAEILGQDVVPVHRDVELAEGLSDRGAQRGNDPVLVERLNACNLELGDQPLRALFHVNRDGYVPNLALVVVLDDRGDFHVSETILLIQAGDRFFIAPKIAPAVAAAPELERGGLHVHALPDGLCVEVAVAGDLDLHQFMALSQIDQVVDVRFVIDDALRLELDLDFEIALGLKIIPQVPLSFDEQVPVHGMLLENRRQPLQLSAR